jgi:hypothetical protein
MDKNIFAPVPDPDAAMRCFDEGLRQVLSVPKSDLVAAMAKEKASREGKPKRGPKPKRTAGRVAVSSISD